VRPAPPHRPSESWGTIMRLPPLRLSSYRLRLTPLVALAILVVTILLTG